MLIGFRAPFCIKNNIKLCVEALFFRKFWTSFWDWNKGFSLPFLTNYHSDILRIPQWLITCACWGKQQMWTKIWPVTWTLALCQPNTVNINTASNSALEGLLTACFLPVLKLISFLVYCLEHSQVEGCGRQPPAMVMLYLDNKGHKDCSHSCFLLSSTWAYMCRF